MSSTEDQAPAAAPAPHKKPNSYYYWHGHEKERAAVGDVAPMPVPVLVSKADPASPTDAAAAAAVPLTTFSFADGTSVASVYLNPFKTLRRPTASAADEEVVEGSVEVSFTARGVEVRLSTRATSAGGAAAPVTVKRFAVSRLCQKIDPEASKWEYKPKTHEVVLKLRKLEKAAWPELESAAAKSDSDDDNDKPKKSDDDE